MLQDGNVEIICLSSLAKVFADGELNALPWNKGSMLCNEVYSFQIAYRWNYDNARPMDSVAVHINSELSDWIMVRKVELSPSDFPIYADHDDNILRSTPGLFPDLLRPVDQY